jgi:hypothetical protein
MLTSAGVPDALVLRLPRARYRPGREWHCRFPSETARSASSARNACLRTSLRVAVALSSLGLLLLSAARLASGTYNPFIYFKF